MDIYPEGVHIGSILDNLEATAFGHKPLMSTECRRALRRIATVKSGIFNRGSEH